MKINLSEKYYIPLIAALLALLLFPFLGQVHLFDWDEANFAELAREMILTKNYLQPQINYLPFYEKPPVFIWMQVASMKIFGINEFAARFPNACLGILVAITLYLIGKKEKDSRFGLIWAMCYMGSFLPFMYFRSGLIDPWFNYFMFLSLYFYKWAVDRGQLVVNSTKHKVQSIIVSALMLGLAVQTKGPAAMIIVYGTLGIIWLISKFKFFLGWWQSFLWFFLSILFSSVWFYIETRAHGINYMKEFVVYQIRLFTTEDALHGGPFYYHFIVLLLGCFPASFILLFKKNWKENWKDSWFKIMTICGILVLILFSIVQTKIIHYSSMAYYPVSYLAAVAIYQMNFRKSLMLKRLCSFFILLLIACIILLPIVGLQIECLIPFIKDKQAKLQLAMTVNWQVIEIFYGLLILGLFIFTVRKWKNSFVPYFIATIFIVLTLLVVFSPKIERYVQGPLIDFYKSKKGENVDIVPLYIKSYACFFYADKKPFENRTEKNHIYYLYEKINRNVYFVLRNKDAHNIDTTILTDVHLLKEKDGYSIYCRKANDYALNFRNKSFIVCFSSIERLEPEGKQRPFSNNSSETLVP